MFFNADYFRDRVRAIIAAAKTPVEWVVIDASSINVMDVTAVQKNDELREELFALGIVLATARVKKNLARFFKQEWGVQRRDLYAKYHFDTLKSAVRTFNNRIDEGASPGSDSWRIWNAQLRNLVGVLEETDYRMSALDLVAACERPVCGSLSFNHSY